MHDVVLAGLGADFPATTERLTLVQREQKHADAEGGSATELSAMLSAEVPQSWPPPFVSAPVGGEGVTWRNQYVIHTAGGERPTLIGLSGVARWPAEERMIQVGCGVVPEYHGRRIGEEVVGALATWALSQPDVDRVFCDIPEDHVASAKSLERAGYSKADEVPSVGFVRFVKRRTGA